MAHTLWGVLLSESEQIHLLPIALSLTEFFLQWDIKNLNFIRSWNEAPWVLARLKSQLDTTEWLNIARVSAMWVWVPISGKWFQEQLLEMERWWTAQCFVNSVRDGERSWRTGRKSSGKNMPKNPSHILLEKLLNAWPVPTIFIGLILGAKEVKSRRTLIHLGKRY